MYCALAPEERREIIISNDAGSFVCNNLIFKMNYYHPHHQFGFIHVPAHNCDNLEQKNKTTVEKLEKMLIKIVDASTRPSYAINLPHWENQFRLPVEKHEIKVIREQSPKGSCLREFTSKLKSPDIWNWFKISKHHN
jgi:hypothetical protein